MSASFIIPFNNDPTSNTVTKTANYTVPAGKYARVVPSSWDGTWAIPTNSNGASFTAGLKLNGALITSLSFSITSSFTNSTLSTKENWAIIPNYSSNNCLSSVYDSNNSRAYLNIESIAGSSAQYFGISASSSLVVANYNSLPSISRIIFGGLSPSPTAYTGTYTFSCAFQPYYFWAKSGDVIDVNGFGKILVEEFSSIV